MKIRESLSLCALVLILASSSQCVESATVTVRFIDARNGKPYTDYKGPWQILLYRVDPSKGFHSLAEAKANEAGTIRQVPDTKGEVRFTLPNPMPGVIDIPAYPIGCGRDLFDTKEVLEKGIVGENLCRTKLRKMNVKFEAKPGEIVYFVAPLSFWERVHRALVF